MPAPRPSPLFQAERKSGNALRALLSLLAACAFAGCAGRNERPAGDEFSVMSYNLFRYCYDDRDRDGQRNDPKPEAEIAALLATIAGVKPDVLAVQEMGSPDLMQQFAERLKAHGLDYPHVEYVPGSLTNLNIAVLSRFPFASRQSATNDSYTIGEMTFPVQRGIISVDVQVNPAYRFRLMAAHLKSKLFHPAGQTEMRRNEARLLAKHVRRALEEDPARNLLVVGDFNDTHRSAPLGELLGGKRPLLFDLRPRDAVGDVWTHYWDNEDTYERIDYLLVSEGMKPEVVAGKTRILRSETAARASDHRPLVGVFKARDIGAGSGGP